MENKSKIINIVIGVLVLLLIIVLVATRNGKNKTEVPADTDGTASVTETPTTISNAPVVPLPPQEEWVMKTINDEISFDVPRNYYISHPKIDGCDSVSSISTQTSAAPAISVALIYKRNCLNNADVLASSTHQVIINGYVFQTSSTNQSVVNIFNKIVASAK